MNIGLLMPKMIYAVVGHEINIYFKNIVTVINTDNYAFEVESQFGRTDAERWHWIPSVDDVGEHVLRLSVWNDDGKVAESESILAVSPADAGVGKELFLLEIGASCMVGDGHGNALWELFQASGNPKLTMLGSHAPGYKEVQPGGPANEAYGGWNWRTFFDKVQSSNLDNDGLHPKRPHDVPSPFMFKENGAFVFDFAKYLDKYCGGKRPDAVMFELGVNGLFIAKNDEEARWYLDNNILPYMKRMMAEIRRVTPDVKFGVELIPPGSSSQDAFGANYGTQQSRRRWLINAYLLHKCYMDIADELQYDLVPAYINYDCDRNYPRKSAPAFEGSETMVERVANALHPTFEGYRQWADSEFFWLKHIVSSVELQAKNK